MAPESLVLSSSMSHITTITINRPAHRNCLTKETISQLISAFEIAGRDPSARCIMLRGAGNEAFCAGADLRELIDDPSPDSRRAMFESIARLIETIHRTPLPVVALVHGFALAGGCGLAAACDITVAADDAVFGLPEVGIGLAPMVVMGPLSRTITRKALSHLVLTGERISAAQALDAGLVTAVAPKNTADEEALLACQGLCKQSPQALQAAKAALIDVGERDYFPFLRELADRSALVSLGSDAEEGMRAFTEKRAPSWRA